MRCIDTSIPAVKIIEPDVFVDERGYFFESYNSCKLASFGINCDFVQDNQSCSSYGVIRGLHCQVGSHAQAKLVRVIAGEVLDVAVDVRPDSTTYGKHISVVLSAKNNKQLFVPRGFLHGFSVLSDSCILAYKCDNMYCKEAERSVRYNEPTLAINWRIAAESAIVSAKDLAAGGMADVAYYG